MLNDRQDALLRDATVRISEFIHAETEVTIGDQSIKLKNDLERVDFKRGPRGITWDGEGKPS